MENKVRYYSSFQRFWHWLQALSIVGLVLTGFEIYGFWSVLGFERAVKVHYRIFSVLAVLFVFAFFWYIITGQWRQFIPSREKILPVAKYYLVGVFKGEQHPHKRTPERRLNSLQSLTYLLIMMGLLPFMGITGGLYYYYHDLLAAGFSYSLAPVAFLHIIGAIAFVVFLLGHIYMLTFGEGIWPHVKSMLTGWGTAEEK